LTNRTFTSDSIRAEQTSYKFILNF